MNPNATLQNLLDGIAVDDSEKVSEAAESLSQWIGRGGLLSAVEKALPSRKQDGRGVSLASRGGGFLFGGC
jgi:hypothetical protein